MFVSIAQLFYGQEKYTIQGEFPDNSRLGNLNSLNIYALFNAPSGSRCFFVVVGLYYKRTRI